ncbi:unnamed protein product [Absidia cylindrospora]
MKAIVRPEDKVTERIIREACHPTDVYGTAGKSLASAESIYGFPSPREAKITKSFLPIEAQLFKNEPKYMQPLRPSLGNGGIHSSTAVERDFLNNAKNRKSSKIIKKEH